MDCNKAIDQRFKVGDLGGGKVPKRKWPPQKI